MDKRLVVLRLVLDELGMEPTIDSLQERVGLQKAIYITQEAGIQLGYRFSWYVRGPYSTALARDYYALEMASVDESEVEMKKRLKKEVKLKIKKIRSIMSVPSDVELESSAWLELISSAHYIFKTIGKTDRDLARKRLVDLKPHLCQHITPAERELSRNSLLPVNG